VADEVTLILCLEAAQGAILELEVPSKAAGMPAKSGLGLR